MRLEYDAAPPACDRKLVRAILGRYVSTDDAVIGLFELLHELGPDGDEVVEAAAGAIAKFNAGAAERLLGTFLFTRGGSDLPAHRRAEKGEVMVQVADDDREPLFCDLFEVGVGRLFEAQKSVIAD